MFKKSLKKRLGALSDFATLVGIPSDFPTGLESMLLRERERERKRKNAYFKRQRQREGERERASYLQPQVWRKVYLPLPPAFQTYIGSVWMCLVRIKALSLYQFHLFLGLFVSLIASVFVSLFVNVFNSGFMSVACLF